MDSSIKIEHGYSTKNPLLIDTVIQHLLEFLPFFDLKKSRLVCHQWNRIAECLIKKRGLIVFSGRLRPSYYCEYLSQTHSIPVEPFTAFEFPGGGPSMFSIYELHELFMKFGKIIKCLRVHFMRVFVNKNEPFRRLNMDHFMELLGTNLEELTVFVDEDAEYKSTNLEISLNTLSNVKNLSLKNCLLNVDLSEARISPSKLKLEKVTYHKNGKILDSITLTDFINLKKCSSVCIYGHPERNITLDLSKDSVVANTVSLGDNIHVINCQTSKMKTIKLELQNCTTEALGIHSKMLEVRESTIDLSCLSNALETISLLQCEFVPLNNEPIFLPNLKQLSLLYNYKSNFVLESVSNSVEFTLPRFVNCYNLTVMEIGGFGGAHSVNFLDVIWLPKSLKRLKLFISPRFRFIGRSDPIEVDDLILGGNYCCKTSAVERVLEKIKPKTLVVGHVVILYSSSHSTLNEKNRDTVSEFLSFIIRQGRRVEKILVKVETKDLNSIDRHIFSKYVDKVIPAGVTCYEFVGLNGTAITSAKFQNYWGMTV